MSQSPNNREVELKDALGIESWRNLKKETLIQFLNSLPDVDRELALKLIDQLPGITELARAESDNAAKAYDAALTSNDHSQENVHQHHLKHLEALQAELQKDLTHEQWLRVLEDMKAVTSSAAAKDTENKRFISEQLDKRLRLTGMIVLGVIGAALLLATGRSPSPSNLVKG